MIIFHTIFPDPYRLYVYLTDNMPVFFPGDVIVEVEGKRGEVHETIESIVSYLGDFEVDGRMMSELRAGKVICSPFFEKVACGAYSGVKPRRKFMIKESTRIPLAYFDYFIGKKGEAIKKIWESSPTASVYFDTFTAKEVYICIEGECDSEVEDAKDALEELIPKDKKIVDGKHVFEGMFCMEGGFDIEEAYGWPTPEEEEKDNIMHEGRGTTIFGFIYMDVKDNYPKLIMASDSRSTERSTGRVFDRSEKFLKMGNVVVLMAGSRQQCKKIARDVAQDKSIPSSANFEVIIDAFERRMKEPSDSQPFFVVGCLSSECPRVVALSPGQRLKKRFAGAAFAAHGSGSPYAQTELFKRFNNVQMTLVKKPFSNHKVSIPLLKTSEALSFAKEAMAYAWEKDSHTGGEFCNVFISKRVGGEMVWEAIHLNFKEMVDAWRRKEMAAAAAAAKKKKEAEMGRFSFGQGSRAQKRKHSCLEEIC
ncbi:unnamed protein product [Cuscuta campestris]|uniref:K Homology domain-containing protein n=1 Tax=Cuscuta campestris TaxID=132261 RepID=A0A484LW33_9ASTE|nr:unnamed protein product [Cuscuta campestris]